MVPHRGGIVLVLTRMNQIKEVSDAQLVAVCEPGMRTLELAQAAAAKGLVFPPDPGSQSTATIGGNVAECAGGPRALMYSRATICSAHRRCCRQVRSFAAAGGS
jgi:glycolate oxidase